MSWLSEDQAELGRVVRSLLSKVGDSGKRRETIASPDGFDRDTWRVMAEQVGLQGLNAPESVGGSGAGAVELCVVLEELGRALYPSPFLSTVLHSQTLLSALPASSRRDDLLASVVSGDRIVVLIDGRDPIDGGAPLEVTSNSDSGWHVSGSARLVPDVVQADVVLVLATGPEPSGSIVLEVETGQAAVQRTELDALDPTRRLGKVVFDNAAADLVAQGRAVEEAAGHEKTLAVIGLAAESVGVAAGALDIAVEHAKTREQFGRSIGSFQALKHMLADAKFDVETSRAAVMHAAAELDAQRIEPLQMWSAAAYVGDATYRVTATMLQVLGGIGFTYEHDAHFFYKRAITNRQWHGGPDSMLDRIASLLIDNGVMADDIALCLDESTKSSTASLEQAPWSEALEQV